jgi:uncharacterized repeat protein (TIGR01451 family)
MRLQREHLAVLAILLLGLLAVTACTQSVGAIAPPAAERPDPGIVEALTATARTEDRVAVIAGFNTPELDGLDDDAREATIAREREAFLNRLPARGIEVTRTYEYLSLVAMRVDETTLAALVADPYVTVLQADEPVEPQLQQSVGLIRADYNHILAYTGTGQTVAVLDTGIDRFHPDLAGKVVSGACYSTPDNSLGATSTCPGGATSSVNINSSGACVGTSGCNHGTHVAGIVAGVAPNANLISIQVFRSVNNQDFCSARGRTSPCVSANGSDVIAGLNRVYALRNTYNIAAVNLSLGGGRFTDPAACETTNGAYRQAINLLRNANINVVAGSGNSDYRNAMTGPACLTGVISVAASDKNNVIGDFSNISIFTTLYAPGVNINSAIPGTGNPPPRASFNGTSMAAPHVAGAVALLKQARPNATPAQITNALTTTGPLIADNRPSDPANNNPAGSVTKRRLDAFLALCQLITCDADDFRTIGVNQTLNGAINPATDVDTYHFFGNAGDRVSIRLNRTSGTLNPFLELFSPNNFRVAFNADGGGGNNSLVNGYFLPQSGRYIIRARGITGTGNYQISVTRDSVPLNPVPRITRLSPGSATATPFGSDFWVAIYGEGFLNDSEVRWNGQLRAKHYTSPELIYIRVRGSDIGNILSAPRLAFVTVRNPTPGGGTSNSYPFSINVPFLGESELVSPESGSSVSADIQATFVISWTHPTDSWRTMQRMDMRLRDPDSGQVAVWLRVIERPGETSTFRLMDATAGSVPAEEIVDDPREGLPGEGPDLVIPGRVTVHMEQSAFSGSGRTAIMTPTLSFDPSLVGVYNIEFEVDSETPLDEFGNLQADDVLGTFHILPAGCTVAASEVSLSGPATGTTGQNYTFTATAGPSGVTAPVSYTWSPEPLSGQGTASATFRWDEAGEQVVGLSVENCGGFAAAAESIAISSGPGVNLSLRLSAPATAVAGQPFDYELVVRNDGATTANNVAVSAPIPPGATYISGGNRTGNTVNWTVADLPGFGAEAIVNFTVSAGADISAAAATANAPGATTATSNQPVPTRAAADQILLSPTEDGLLEAGGIRIAIPGGAVFTETELALQLPGAPSVPLPSGIPALGPIFRLRAYQDGEAVAGPLFFEPLEVTFSSTGLPDEGSIYALVGNNWQPSGKCSRANAGLVCVLPPGATATEYALLEGEEELFLPVVIR